MKNILTALLLSITILSFGQTTMNIYENNGTTLVLPINTVDSFNYVTTPSPARVNIYETGGGIISKSVANIDSTTFTLDATGGAVYCAGTPTIVVDVTNGSTGKIWMDRNLGATNAATSSTDDNSYGDLYQWGRGSDGHQCRNSSTITTLSSTDQPGHGDFIVFNSFGDWRSPGNDNLWQGVNGTNNPCPSGYRLPTNAELNAERTSWSSNSSAGAFTSPLKLPMAGNREGTNGSVSNVGSIGFYWSSTVNGTSVIVLYLNGGSSMLTSARGVGFSVRCIKD
jgi:hypothetical protein